MATSESWPGPVNQFVSDSLSGVEESVVCYVAAWIHAIAEAEPLGVVASRRSSAPCVAAVRVIGRVDGYVGTMAASKSLKA